MKKKSALLFIERLEPRALFASAPPTVLGLSAAVTITDGSQPLASAGTYTIDVGANGREYKLNGDAGVQDSTGSYSYSRPKPNVGELVVQDSISGAMTVDFTFSTTVTGTVKLTRKAGGSQTGTFVLSGGDFANLLRSGEQGAELNIVGTTDGDAIGVSIKGEFLAVTRNNITQKFDTEHGLPLIMLVNSDAGNDLINTAGIPVPTYVNAGAGNDTVTSGSANDTLTGGAGRNILTGNEGDDRLNGSGSADLLSGGLGADRLYGNGGNDTLDGGGQVDRLYGGDGNDQLFGGSSNDKLFGEAGDDVLKGQGQSDILDGGDGSNDTAFVDLLDPAAVNCEHIV